MRAGSYIDEDYCCVHVLMINLHNTSLKTPMIMTYKAQFSITLKEIVFQNVLAIFRFCM